MRTAFRLDAGSGRAAAGLAQAPALAVPDPAVPGAVAEGRARPDRPARKVGRAPVDSRHASLFAHYPQRRLSTPRVERRRPGRGER